MDSESIRLLRARQQDIAKELSNLKPRVFALEEEDRQIEAGIRAMQGVIAPTGNRASAASVAHFARIANPDIAKLTIKEMVVKALAESFPNGATANQLLDHFYRAWGRKEMRTSLSPQLSRLKEDKMISLEGRVWHLGPKEKGAASAAPETGEGATSLDTLQEEINDLLGFSQHQPHD